MLTETKTTKVSRVEICEVTPPKAEAWLQKNHDANRTRRPKKVAQYAEDMRRGRWVLSTQVIAFGENGELYNGQHTLEAVIKSGVNIRCIVLWNAPPGSVMAMDSGMKRSTDDHFSMSGKKYPIGCGSTVRRALMGLKNFAGNAISDFRVDEFMMQHGKAVEFIHTASRNNKFSPASVRAVLLRAMLNKKIVGERVERFCEVLESGLMAAGENGAVLLRNHILETKGYTADSGTARRDLYAIAETAVQGFISAEKVRKLTPAKTELFPISEECA